MQEVAFDNNNITGTFPQHLRASRAEPADGGPGLHVSWPDAECMLAGCMLAAALEMGPFELDPCLLKVLTSTSCLPSKLPDGLSRGCCRA